MLLRLVSRMLVAVLAAAAPAISGAADAWPAKPVRIIVPFPAGGATDVVARLLAQKLSEAWGQGVVVDDRAGAGGNIGADVVAHSPADGYTLLMTSGSVVTANPYLYRNMTFDPAKDLLPITNVATGPQVIVVNAALPFKTLQDLIDYAHANPGKINFGSAGVGTQTHLAAENFAYSGKLDMTHVPYKGEALALNDLMAGQVQMVTPNLGAAIGLIKGGKIHALAVTSPQRSPQMPEIPSASEFLPGFENAGWFGLMAPAGTPREVIEKIYRDSAVVIRSDEFRKRLAEQGMLPVGNTPAELGAAIKAESERWSRIVHERNITAG